MNAPSIAKKYIFLEKISRYIQLFNVQMEINYKQIKLRQAIQIIYKQCTIYL